jgi:hypothetical protein
VSDLLLRPPPTPSTEERCAQNERTTDEDDDDLRTAKGIAAGVVLRLFIWLASIVAGAALWQAVH